MSPTISGEVTDADGNPLEDALVAVVDTDPEDGEGPEDWVLVDGTTTDSTGNYSITVDEGGIERYHVFVQYEENGTYYRSDSIPYVTVNE